MKWQAKPDKEGYYLMRSGDSSAWTASSFVHVFMSQDYLSMTVYIIDSNAPTTCVDDYSEYVDWLFLGIDVESTKLSEEEQKRLVFLPKVNKRVRDKSTEGNEKEVTK